MKRKTSVLLALLLAFVMVLSACGQKTTGDKKDEPKAEETKDGEKKDDAKTADNAPLKGEITVQADKAWVEFYNKIGDEIKKDNPDAKIIVKEVPAFDHIEIINSTTASNEDVTDVFALPADKFTSLYENEAIAKIDAEKIAKKATGFKNLDESMAKIFKTEEGYFAFPYNIETLFAYVNLNNAKEKKIDVAGKTFELTKPVDVSEIVIPISNGWHAAAVLNAADISMLNKDEKGKLYSDFTTPYDKLDADKKAVFDAIYGYWKLNNEKGTTLIEKWEARDAYVTDTFADGGGGVIRIDGPWAAEGLRDAIEAGGVDVYPINKLTVAGKPMAHWQSGWALALNARIEGDNDKIALAEEFISRLLKPETAPELYLATGKILENAEMEIYEKSDKLTDFDKKLIKTCIDSYKVSKGRPIFKETDQMWPSWENAILSWNNSKPADAKAAYEEVKASFDAMMGSFQ